MASEESNCARMQQSSRMGSLPEAGSGEGHLDVMPIVTLAPADQGEAQQLENTRSLTSKRRVASNDDHGAPKRRHISSGTSSSSTFANLKITKPTLLDQGGTATQYYVPNSGLSHTVNPLSPQTIGTSSSQTLDDPPSLVTHVHGGRNTAPRLLPKTTMDYLTPRLTESSQYSTWGIGEGPRAGNLGASPASADSAEQYAWQEEGATVQPNVHDDDYPIDEEDEENMLRLLSDVETIAKPQFPPSSVANAWDRDSRTMEVYDSALQHSSIQSTPDSCIEVEQSKDQGETEEDLLDDDVDWDAVFTITSIVPKDDSLVGDRELEQRRNEAAANDGTVPSIESLTDLPQARPLSPFTRPQFPAKVRDRASVLGLSAHAVLRVCFRVEELIQEAARCCHLDQEAIFELYARVTYSSREPLVKKQHFQFRDLFEDKQPFPSGTLSGWRPGSLVDQKSQVFLGNCTPQLCWVLSKTRLDSKSSFGLTLEIINIRETDWDQIRLAKAIICGEEVDTGAEETASVS